MKIIGSHHLLHRGQSSVEFERLCDRFDSVISDFIRAHTEGAVEREGEMVGEDNH
jgi:hypothetical protein